MKLLVEHSYCAAAVKVQKYDIRRTEDRTV